MPLLGNNRLGNSLLVNSLLVNNLKLAFRLLGRNPVSSLVLALTLGLGIGLSSVVFSLADAILFRPLPFPEPERLVAVYEASKSRDDIRVADGNFFDLRQQATALDGLAGYACNRDLVTAGANTYQVPVCAVTGDFFPVLGVSPALGQATLLQGETASGGAVVSHRFWQTALGGDPAALGRTLRVFGLAVPVTGVMPAGFAFPVETEVWVAYEPFLGESRTAHNMLLLGRLRPDSSLASARSQMSTMASRLAQSYGHEIGKDFGLAVKDLHADLVGDTDKTVLLLWVIVSTVLFIACGNIAGILLARTLGRLTEISIRQSLGASRLQLGLQLLTESGVLGVLGSLAGLALAGVLLPVASSLVPASFLHSGPLVLDLRVVAFSILMGLLAGILCAVLPVFQVTRRMPLESLHTGVLPAVGGGRPRRLAGVFVVAQYALSLAAVVAAGLLVESLIRLVRVDPGFATGGRVTAEIIVPTQPPSRYAEEGVLTQYYEDVLREVASLPGVRRATLSQSLPFVGQQYNGMALREGEPMPSEGDAQLYPDYRAVGGGYFATMDIPLVLGRDFLSSDGGSAEPVVIVNQALARQMWGSGNPLGRRLKLPGLDFDEVQADRLLRVVGVVPDVRQGARPEAQAGGLRAVATAHDACRCSLRHRRGHDEPRLDGGAGPPADPVPGPRGPPGPRADDRRIDQRLDLGAAFPRRRAQRVRRPGADPRRAGRLRRDALQPVEAAAGDGDPDGGGSEAPGHPEPGAAGGPEPGAGGRGPRPRAGRVPGASPERPAVRRRGREPADPRGGLPQLGAGRVRHLLSGLAPGEPRRAPRGLEGPLTFRPLAERLESGSPRQRAGGGADIQAAGIGEVECEAPAAPRL